MSTAQYYGLCFVVTAGYHLLLVYLGIRGVAYAVIFPVGAILIITIIDWLVKRED